MHCFLCISGTRIGVSLLHIDAVGHTSCCLRQAHHYPASLNLQLQHKEQLLHWQSLNRGRAIESVCRRWIKSRWIPCCASACSMRLTACALLLSLSQELGQKINFRASILLVLQVAGFACRLCLCKGCVRLKQLVMQLAPQLSPLWQACLRRTFWPGTLTIWSKSISLCAS